MTMTTQAVRVHEYGPQSPASERPYDIDRPEGRAWTDQRGTSSDRFTQSLGWLSIGLGVAYLAAPEKMAKLAGVQASHDGVIRAIGLREVATGIGLVAQRQPTFFLRSRIGGHAMDLALIAVSMRSDDADRRRLTAAAAMVGGNMVLDLLSAQNTSRLHAHAPDSGTFRVSRAVTINRTPNELYRYWRQLENLPRFMEHLLEVTVLPDTPEHPLPSKDAPGEGSTNGGRPRSHWVTKGIAGQTVEWDAEIVAEHPNELIAWKSLPGGKIHTGGAVRFIPGRNERETIVRVDLHYQPPGGSIGAALAKLFGEDPEQQIKQDLRRFKQMMETGEVITTDGQPSGRMQG